MSHAWYWMSDLKKKVWTAYPSSATKKLESAFQRKLKRVKINDIYSVNLVDMYQFQNGDDSKQRPVRRGDGVADKDKGNDSASKSKSADEKKADAKSDAKKTEAKTSKPGSDAAVALVVSSRSEKPPADGLCRIAKLPSFVVRHALSFLDALTLVGLRLAVVSKSLHNELSSGALWSSVLAPLLAPYRLPQTEKLQQPIFSVLGKGRRWELVDSIMDINNESPFVAGVKLRLWANNVAHLSTQFAFLEQEPKQLVEMLLTAHAKAAKERAENKEKDKDKDKDTDGKSDAAAQPHAHTHAHSQSPALPTPWGLAADLHLLSRLKLKEISYGAASTATLPFIAHLGVPLDQLVKARRERDSKAKADKDKGKADKADAKAKPKSKAKGKGKGAAAESTNTNTNTYLPPTKWGAIEPDYSRGPLTGPALRDSLPLANPDFDCDEYRDSIVQDPEAQAPFDIPAPPKPKKEKPKPKPKPKAKAKAKGKTAKSKSEEGEGDGDEEMEIDEGEWEDEIDMQMVVREDRVKHWFDNPHFIDANLINLRAHIVGGLRGLWFLTFHRRATGHDAIRVTNLALGLSKFSGQLVGVVCSQSCHNFCD